MSTIASQITSLTIVYSTVYLGADQSKHQSSASLAFVWGIHRGPVNSPHKWPVTRKMFPFDDVIMNHWNHFVCPAGIIPQLRILFIYFPLFVIPLNSGSESMTSHSSFWIQVFDHLTQWGWGTHMCVDNIGHHWFIIRRQAIFWTNAGICLLDPWEQTSVKF